VTGCWKKAGKTTPMQSIFLIIRANLRRRKRQNMLVGSCIVLGAMLFATTLSMLSSIDRPYDLMFEELAASHLLIYYDQQQYETSDLRDWLLEQTEVTSVGEATPYFPLSEPILYQGQEVDLMVQLTEYTKNHLIQDQVKIIRGEVQASPSPGEIWIPDHLARNHHISIGDTLDIPLSGAVYPLNVSATVVDPHFASSLFNPTRAWIGPGSLAYYISLSQLHQRVLGVRLKSATDTQLLKDRFQRHFFFEGNLLDYSLFKSVFLSFYQIISFVLLVFSGLAIIAGLFILYSSLTAAIRQDLPLIGIYRAQGLSPGNLILAYTLQYIFLALISLPISMLGSYLLTKVILQSLVRALGLIELPVTLAGPLSISFIGLLLMVAGIAFLGSARLRKIKPVAAINGSISTNALSKINLTGLMMKSWIKTPVFLGIKMLLAHPKRLFYTLMSLIFALFILVFSINISHSFARLGDNKAAWGLEDSDLQIRRNQKAAIPLEHPDLLGSLKKNTRIQAVVPYAYLEASLLNQQNEATQSTSGKVYTAPIDQIGLNNLEGRHPQGAAEIALCILTAKEWEKQTGDSLDLFIEGQRKRFYVSGIYQDVSNMGKGFRLAGTAMQVLNPLFEPDLYAIKLTENQAAAHFKQELQSQFGETVLLELSIEERRGLRSTIGGIRSALLLVSLFFLLILFIVLFNETLMSLQEFRSSFGLLKAIGMVPRQIRLALVSKTLINSGIAILIGLPLTLWLSPYLMSGATRGIGLQTFPYLNQIEGILLAMIGFMLFAVGSVWIASRSLATLVPKDLIND
jgi:putative ABC transport system permease protein